MAKMHYWLEYDGRACMGVPILDSLVVENIGFMNIKEKRRE
jgi:hypothetical protein